ncbi:hypothetical protein [Streptomyces kronopolitis]|uniref:hypothetical protein n=1 Tax=Streptomyces kronopolitis TaxID=1612435 RepID=UPI0034305437
MRCLECGSAVLWTFTEAGKRLAVDAAPDVDGNTAVYRDGTGTWRSRRPTDELPVMGWEKLHRPHVATCAGPRARPGAAPSLPSGVADMAAYRRRNRSRP